MKPDVLVTDELRMLIEHTEPGCVSLYMPTHPVTTGMEQDQIRFKNLIREAGEKLSELGWRTVDKALKPLHALQADRSFWQYQSDGLAVFFSPELYRTYRLPLKFDELVVVADRFHIKPVLPLLSGDGVFYVLALSQHDVRLFQCTQHSVRQIELEGVKVSLPDALWHDDPEKQLQFHTGAREGGESGKRPAMYHGHGVGTEDNKDEILRFFQQLDPGVREFLPAQPPPVVLAGVDYLFPLYRQASSIPTLVQEGVPGNPEELSADELAEAGRRIVTPIFEEESERAEALYHQLLGTGRASADLAEIVKAAYYGRIDTLFVAVGERRWGAFDSSSDEVAVEDAQAPTNYDLLDFAAAHTVLNSGTVYAREPDRVPEKGPAAAVFRY